MKRTLSIFIAIIAVLGFYAVAFVGIYTFLTSGNSEVQKVSGEVVDITPVGHRNSTSYAVEIQLADKRIFHDFRTAPTSDRVSLYEVKTGDSFEYYSYDPKGATIIVLVIVGAMALIPTLIVGAVAGMMIPEKPHSENCRCSTCFSYRRRNFRDTFAKKAH